MTKSFQEQLGKLSIAILESQVEKLVGEKAVNILRASYEDRDLKSNLINALSRAEKRFRNEYNDKELASALLDLPLATLPSIQNALQHFYNNPADHLLQNKIEEQLAKDLVQYKPNEVKSATITYMRILREELLPVSDEIRQKLTSIAILGIEEKLGELSRGDLFFNKIQKKRGISKNIKSQTFRTLVDERTRNFIGREYIFEAIEELLVSEDFPSGYILIYGEPGIGKTSLIAQLVKTTGFVHHFNIASQNIRNVNDFLANTCSQLIINYDLDISELPENATKDSGFLLELLSRISKTVENQKIVVLVDAIDEAIDDDTNTNANRLWLPTILPKNVFFILTTRENTNYRLLVDNRKDIYIADNDPENLQDIKLYVKSYISQFSEHMQKRIINWGVSEDYFVDLLTEKSQGNFMYIVHVLRDIKDNKISYKTLTDIQKLPTGLRQYYQRHWKGLEEDDSLNFNKYEKPVVCILASVREPVSIRQLSDWTNLEEYKIKKTIEKWRAFLNFETNHDGDIIYRIYHSSFQDFLREEVGLKPYHETIAKSALKKIRRQG